MAGPRNWKKFQPHPLANDYAPWSTDKFELAVDRLKQFGNVDNRKIVMHEGLVLDGNNFLRACVEAGVTPGFAKLKRGCPPEIYVEIKNDLRRHEDEQVTMERAARRQRIFEARTSGESIRSIAEREGVSKATVAEDIAKTGAVPEQPVTGTDGKAYKTPDAIFCDRCQRVGPIKNCPTCSDLRTEASYNARNKAPKNRSSVGKIQLDWKQIHKELGPVMRLPDRIDRAHVGERHSDDYKHASALLDKLATVVHEWEKRLSK